MFCINKALDGVSKSWEGNERKGRGHEESPQETPGGVWRGSEITENSMGRKSLDLKSICRSQESISISISTSICHYTYFCSWNLCPTRSLCFKNFSEHLAIHPDSLVVKLAEVSRWHSHRNILKPSWSISSWNLSFVSVNNLLKFLLFFDV